MRIAVTKIWAVKDSLKRVVEYAANPAKTEYGGLAQALHYAEDGSKTVLEETLQLVSGVHCRPEHAWEDMRAVQVQFGKTGGTVALHAYQSFKPGEVTPEQCHSIGVELARRMWGGRLQVLVATHMNTNCLHNHFVVNSVAYTDGKKYEQKRSQYHELRSASDEICRKYQLSVIEQPVKGKMPRILYEAEQRGEPTCYNQMRAAISKAKNQASTERDLARALYSLGYIWNHDPRRKYITLRPRDGSRAVRIHRLGEEYDWPAVKNALITNYARWGPRWYDMQNNPLYRPGGWKPSPVRHTRRCRCRGLDKAEQQSGLWRLYMYYCYQLGIYPQRQPRVNWPEIRALWRDTEQLCRELNFVHTHKFADRHAVAEYRLQLEQQTKALCEERKECARQLRRKNYNPARINALEARRAELTGTLKKLRREETLTTAVMERIERTAEARSYMREQQRTVPQRAAVNRRYEAER